MCVFMINEYTNVCVQGKRYPWSHSAQHGDSVRIANQNSFLFSLTLSV